MNAASLSLILTKMLNSFETTFTSSQHPCPVTKEIPQAPFLFLISLVSLWSDAGDQWLSPTLGSVGRPQRETDTLSESRQTVLRSV